MNEEWTELLRFCELPYRLNDQSAGINIAPNFENLSAPGHKIAADIELTNIMNGMTAASKPEDNQE